MFYRLFYEWLYVPDTATSIFRLFRYITFRTAYATITALVITFLLGPWVIRKLKNLKVTQVVKEKYLKSHGYKSATPTMGGIIILFALLGSTLLWARLDNRFILLVFGVTMGFGGLGLLDDYLKLVRRKPEGLVARYKLIGQFLIAAVLACYLYFDPVGWPEYTTQLAVPFFNKPPLDLGWLYIPFIILVIVGASNAVNLTDGLDGLAIGAVVFAAIAYAGVAYITGNYNFANYLKVSYLSGTGELTVYLGALIGAGLGFLWFNSYPAQVFMGDTGSLALGGALGTVAVLTRHEILLVIIGGLFVMEALSVILQVISYKFRGKRIWLMTPLHHHFELKGWAEPKIVVRFWILAGIFTLLSLSTFKLR